MLEIGLFVLFLGLIALFLAFVAVLAFVFYKDLTEENAEAEAEASCYKKYGCGWAEAGTSMPGCQCGLPLAERFKREGTVK